MADLAFSALGTGINADHIMGVGRVEVLNAFRTDPFAGNQVLMDGYRGFLSSAARSSP
jgi:hypothetical protein